MAELKTKTSKLAIISAVCALIVIIIIFFTLPVADYLDRKQPNDQKPITLAFNSFFFAMIVIPLGFSTGLTGYLRIKNSDGKLKGVRLAQFGMAVSLLPIIFLAVAALFSTISGT